MDLTDVFEHPLFIVVQVSGSDLEKFHLWTHLHYTN